MREFLLASPEDILTGRVTDAYFERTEKVLSRAGRNPEVVMELHVKQFPSPDYGFGVLAGTYEIYKLLEGLPVEVEAAEEGTLFFPGEPVMNIKGPYLSIARLETAILGFVSFMSGIATKAARCRLAAWDKTLLSFGTRRMHPAVAPAVEYSSYVGGMDGVSNVAGAERIGIKASGTMPHALVLCLKEPGIAFEFYDKYLEPDVPRVMLVDTTGAPFQETMEAAAKLGEKLQGIRLDTKDLAYTLAGIRWELDRMGLGHVKFWMSGGLDEYELPKYANMVDGFGIGTKLVNAPVMDFALKIVEVDGEPRAKFSNIPGRKAVWRRKDEDLVTMWDCEADGQRLLTPRLKAGIRQFEEKSPAQVREYVLQQLAQLEPGVARIRNPERRAVVFKAKV
ncbi:nicotinate phosphoribosyltransferase [Coprothermobacteraceae bacterium]|nr:nicotinate phosphoribosyltransferase [Coprothermobacteraceae bacterium]